MHMHSKNVETKLFRRGLSLVGVALGVLCLLSGYAQAVPASNTATATASAIVFQPITVAVADSTTLNFGKFAPTGVAGTVSIDAMNGSRSSSNVFLFTGSPSGRLKLQVVGEPDEGFVLSITTSPVTLTCDSGPCTGGSTPMPVTLFKAFPGTGGGSSPIGDIPTTHTLDGFGVLGVGLGGTLNVAADQTPGTYSGTFNVSVAYQ